MCIYLRHKNAKLDPFVSRRHDLYDTKENGKDTAFWYDYRLPEKRPFVIVVPGGGYGFVSMDNEGDQIARKINECGYSAFILKYRVGKYALAPNPQDDVATLVKYIFDNAKELNVDTKDYAIVGFSAGGHLAGSWCTKNMGYQRYELEPPKSAFLIYPVITMQGDTHDYSRSRLVGERCSQIDKDYYSVECNVDEDFPPVYMWRRADDCCVPGGGARRLKEALDRLKIPCVLKEFEGTQHGEGLGIGKPMEGWVEEAVDFWQKLPTIK